MAATATRRGFTVGSLLAAGALAGRVIGGRPAQAQPATPAAGLHVTLAGPVTAIPTLDPALVRDNATMMVARQLFRGLLSVDPSLALRPALAASVTADAHARVFSVRLREGATFAGGRAVLAEDVAASFARALDPATAGGDASALAGVGQLAGIAGADDVLAGRTGRLAGIAVSGPRDLTIALSAPDAAFPGKLASVAASIVDTVSGGPVETRGSGPFGVAPSPSSDILTMARRMYPYEGHGTVSSLSFLLGASATNPANLLQAGSIDIATGLPADQAALLADPASGAGSPTVVRTPAFSLLYLALSPHSAPLDDLHIRRAIQVGFPWGRLAEAAGASVQPARGVIAPGMLGRSWDAAIPAFDPDLARAEIGRSRYGAAEHVPPIPVFTGQTTRSDPLRNVGVALQEVLGERLGLRIEPVSVAWGDFLAGLPAGRFPTHSLTWVADYPDPSAFLDVLFGSGSPDNYAGYRSEAFDAVLAEARATPEEGTRAGLFARAQQMLIDDAIVVPIAFDIGYTAFRTGIGGVPVTPIGLGGLESIHGS